MRIGRVGLEIVRLIARIILTGEAAGESRHVARFIEVRVERIACGGREDGAAELEARGEAVTHGFRLRLHRVPQFGALLIPKHAASHPAVDGVAFHVAQDATEGAHDGLLLVRLGVCVVGRVVAEKEGHGALDDELLNSQPDTCHRLDAHACPSGLGRV